MSKSSLLQDLSTFGKDPNKSWLSYAVKHDIKLGESYKKRAKAANDIWRNYQKPKRVEDSTEKQIKLLLDLIKPEQQKEIDQTMKTISKMDTTWHEKGDVATLEIMTPDQVKNPKDLIASCNIDDSWEVEEFWQSNKSNKWNISAKFKRKKIDENKLLQAQYLLDNLHHNRSLSENNFAISELYKKTLSKRKKLLEISIFDLHIGKLSWEDESGESYDSETACKRFKEAAKNLVSRIDSSEIERILLPIGNDMINIDNTNYTTTAGTPQSCDSRFPKMIQTAKNAIIEVIDMLLVIAPVDIVIVPGNHDEHTMFTLGEILHAFYRSDQNVTVFNTPKLRKYYQYGVNGLMFTHGNFEKHADLGLLFATEEPELWANTKYREAHVGHFHKLKTTHYVNVNEEVGFKVRILPSLSGTDKFHYSRGYHSNKAAKAFLYDIDKGMIAEYTYNQ